MWVGLASGQGGFGLGNMKAKTSASGFLARRSKACFIRPGTFCPRFLRVVTTVVSVLRTCAPASVTDPKLTLPGNHRWPQVSLCQIIVSRDLTVVCPMEESWLILPEDILDPANPHMFGRLIHNRSDFIPKGRCSTVKFQISDRLTSQSYCKGQQGSHNGHKG